MAGLVRGERGTVLIRAARGAHLRWGIAAALALLLSLLVAVPAAGDPAGGDPIFNNHRYSAAERAADMVARMSLSERAAEMASSSAPAIPRLGIPSWGWWNESAHGLYGLELNNSTALTDLVNTTAYPSDLALGSTWDPNLMYAEASAISDEAREIVPENALNLDFFAPTVNLSRDPRWGRNDESFSEDPLLTGTMASQYVDGLQGQDQSGHLLPQGGGYLKAIATVKHYAANNSEANRLTGSSDMDERTLREYYSAPYRQIDQQANPGAMMAAYNEVNGTPAAASSHLLKTLARQAFGFGGYFTSDCDGIDGIVTYHGWQPGGWGRPVNETEAHALANAAGTDLNCNTLFGDPLTDQNLLPAAVTEGIRTPTDTYNVNDLDNSLARLLTARMKLGQFDRIGSEPWVKAARRQLAPGSWTNSDANGAVTETPARLGLDHLVADHALVLLKNVNTTRKDGSFGQVLPLRVPSSGPFRVAVIGYPANPSSMYLGGYAPHQGAPGQAKSVTPYQGIRQAIQSINPGAAVDFYNGFIGGNGSAASLTTIDPAAVAAASSYNDVIVYTGTDRSTAGEDLDRSNLALPGAQSQLISQVAARNPNTVAVMETDGPVDVGGFQNQVPSMLWSSYNGQRKGEALADVLLGRYDPSGHLPFTWYANEGELPSIFDYRVRPGPGTPGRTYMYFRGPVSYPFGFGLSYTSFRNWALRVDHARENANGTFHVTLNATNGGPSYGTDLIQLYIASPGAGDGQRPVKRLAGFTQVALAPGQTTVVRLTVHVPDLAFWNGRRGRFTVDDGRYYVQVASSAADGDVQAQLPVTIRGKLKPAPAALSVQPTMPGDGARRIQSRLLFPEQTVVLPNLSVAMDDESVFHYAGAGHARPPKGMRLRFTSNRPGVVSVGGGGIIRTHRNGVATITAKVSFHGTTKSLKFVIRVISELSSLAVTTGGGSHATTVPVRGFHPDALTYEVIVRDGAKVPRVSASAPSHRAHVTQAGAVPGTARIKVTGRDGITTRYVVYFARPARSDNFHGKVGKQWSWIRHDPGHERIAGGSLVINATSGQDNGYEQDGRNLLVQPALGDWTIQSKLSFSSPPHADTQQGGIIAYQDDRDFLKLDLEYSGGTARLAETTEDSLSGAPVSQVLAALPRAGRLGNVVWLRMVKRGPRYTTFYSANGRHFVPLYSVGASLVNVKVGLFAWGGPDRNNDLNVAFSDFRVRNSGLTIGHGVFLAAPAAPRAHRRARRAGAARATRSATSAKAPKPPSPPSPVGPANPAGPARRPPG